MIAIIYGTCICGKKIVAVRRSEPEWLGEYLEKKHQYCSKKGGPFFPKSRCIGLRDEQTKEVFLMGDRLHTEDMETVSFTQDEQELVFAILESPNFDDVTDWVFDLDGEDKTEAPWIVRMIRKRIVTENLKIEITEMAYFLIMVLTYGNPGKAMFVLHKSGNFFERTDAQKWLVNSHVVITNLFPLGFLTEEAFERWWKNQKVSLESRRSWSDNLVDIFPDEWRRD